MCGAPVPGYRLSEAIHPCANRANATAAVRLCAVPAAGTERDVRYDTLERRERALARAAGARDPPGHIPSLPTHPDCCSDCTA